MRLFSKSLIFIILFSFIFSTGETSFSGNDTPKVHPDQEKIDYYNNLAESHGGSSISDWTDEDYTDHLSPEKAHAFGHSFYVPDGRDSEHTIEVCTDYWYTEGSWKLWDSVDGYGTG